MTGLKNGGSWDAVDFVEEKVKGALREHRYQCTGTRPLVNETFQS